MNMDSGLNPETDRIARFPFSQTEESSRSDSKKKQPENRGRSRSPRERGRYFSKPADGDYKSEEKHNNLNDTGYYDNDEKHPKSSSPENKRSSATEVSESCSAGDSKIGDANCDQKSASTNYGQPCQSAENLSSQRCSRSKRAKRKKTKKLPWVPPPLPEHLRQIPHITNVMSVRQLPCPLQNQFENDGSFMEVFRQRMQAANSLQLTSKQSVSGAAAMLNNLVTAAKEPVVIKRRVSKPLKTGMVQKPKKKVDTADPETMDKDSWSLYMREVQKYRANKCINSEACRPLMK